MHRNHEGGLDREPASLYRFLEDISAVPRASYNEAGIAQYLKRFAEERGLWVRVDASSNVIIKKPGSKGFEHLPPVIFQGHLDMVPETAEDVQHDWAKDPLKLRVNGDILTAEGTTLGNDDGIAIAYVMAILDRNDLVHPPLECVLTSMEEVGMLGAMALDASDLHATRMIGLDAGSEGAFLANSAGGHRVTVTAPAKFVPAVGTALSIHVGGLAGGHSGGMIDKELGNAMKLMGRVLYEIGKTCHFNIASMTGGAKDNVIPRECTCVILLAAADVEKAQTIARRTEAELKVELRDSDGGVRIDLGSAAPAQMLDDASSAIVARICHVLPNGVQAKSRIFPGLVVASSNIGVVTTEADAVIFDISVRYGEDSMGDYMFGVIADIVAACGGTAVRTKGYPAFPYAPESALRKLAMDVYKEVSGQDGTVICIHGGTETGVIQKLLPGVDIIGTGAKAGEAHTSREWVDLASFGRVFSFMLKLLERMTRE